MPPAKKRAKTTHADDKPIPSALLADCRAGWLIKRDEQSVELVARGETFVVHRDVLTRNSEYFERCLNNDAWDETNTGTIWFDDLEPKALAYFVGVAYSHSSIIPMPPPQWADNPETLPKRTALRDFVEVYKLCDRFICPKMGQHIVMCINVAIGDGHRVLFRAQHDESQQRAVMRDFADGYEALNMEHPVQKELGKTMTDYFCEGINHDAWDSCMEDIMDRPGFVSSVSKGFARKLGMLRQARKLRRKELNGPSIN